MPTKKPAAAPRVWIELERPRDVPHAEAICALANIMLLRIGYGSLNFWYHETRGNYCLGSRAAGTYRELADRGEWFDLERCAKGEVKA